MNALEGMLEAEMRYGLAFSGGVDSSFLLTWMLDNDYDVKAYIVKSAFQTDWELRDALEVISLTHAPHEALEVDVLSNREICANPWNRCYLCKRFIFETILKRMAEDGREVLLDGTNASDDPERRPGMKALTELGIVSPLRSAGMTKEDIRAASREIGLFTAEKPNFSCLATKIETDTPITSDRLARLAKEYAEEGLWNQGN